MQSFVKLKPSQYGKITLSFIVIGKSCLSRDFFTSLICLLMLFTKTLNLAKISESTVFFFALFRKEKKLSLRIPYLHG